MRFAVMSDSPKIRSPIKELPLRDPGQSLRERIFDLAYDRVLAPALVAVFLTILWILDVWRSVYALPPTPWVSGAFAIAAIAYAGWRIVTTMPELKSLGQGREGERAVGQGLEQLRAQGYAVYHDILGKDFNVDHVLIGPAGIFTIETKAIGKRARGRQTIVVDGNEITVDGFSLPRDPVPQARAQAAWIADILLKSTGREYPVAPVILFPGWWIESKSRPTGLWVINDKALPKFLAREKPRLSEEQTSMAKFHLEAFIRSQEQARLDDR